MAWIKRNLFFLVGSVIALALLGGAVIYLITRSKLNHELSDKLDAEYSQLNELNQQNPHPGNAKTDNIKAAKEQQKQLLDFIERSGKYFTPIPPVLAVTASTTDQEFSSALSQTIDQLQREAALASVTLPPHYDFSFSAIKSKITFTPGSLSPLSRQLSEVKAICEILFHAKINSLDSIRRERVSSDDKEMADYTDLQSVTNDQAVVTPYEVTLHCFSAELAGVLGGLADSPSAFIVKTVSVDSTAPAQDNSVQVPPVVAPAAPAALPFGADGMSPDERRMRLRMQATEPAPVPVVTAPAVFRGGLPTVLNEHPLKVSLVVELVKLKKAAQ